MILPMPQKERSRTQPQPYDASHYQTHEKYLFPVTAFLEYEYPEQYGEYRAQTCPYGIGYPQWKSLCRWNIPRAVISTVNTVNFLFLKPSDSFIHTVNPSSQKDAHTSTIHIIGHHTPFRRAHPSLPLCLHRPRHRLISRHSLLRFPLRRTSAR